MATGYSELPPANWDNGAAEAWLKVNHCRCGTSKEMQGAHYRQGRDYPGFEVWRFTPAMVSVQGRGPTKLEAIWRAKMYREQKGPLT